MTHRKLVMLTLFNRTRIRLLFLSLKSIQFSINVIIKLESRLPVQTEMERKTIQTGNLL